MLIKRAKYSIKGVTVASSIAGMLVISIIAIMIFDELANRWLTQNYDQSITAKIELFQTLTSVDEDGLEFEFADEFMSEYSRLESAEYFQIWVNGKQVFERSKSLANNNLEYIDVDLNTKLIKDVILPDKRRGRVAYTRFHPQIDADEDDQINSVPKDLVNKPLNKKMTNQIELDSGEIVFIDSAELQVVIAIAKERESLNATIFQANIVLFITFFILLFTSLLVIWFSVGRGLKPLREFQDKLIDVDIKKPNAIIKLNNSPLELTSLVSKFNLMLEGIQKSMLREQQFASDVAHELRTPIAEIRSLTEVALIGDEDKLSLQETLKDVVNVSIQMELLVTQLLLLARNEHADKEIVMQLVDIIDVIENALATNKKVAEQKNIIMELDFVGAREIRSGPSEVRLIINNLVANAIYHANNKSIINLQWHNTSEGFSLSITNSTETLQEKDLAYIFQRLWKKDDARTNSQHCGIGLSLVKVCCENLNYSITPSMSNARFTMLIQANHL